MYAFYSTGDWHFFHQTVPLDRHVSAQLVSKIDHDNGKLHSACLVSLVLFLDSNSLNFLQCLSQHFTKYLAVSRVWHKNLLYFGVRHRKITSTEKKRKDPWVISFT